MSDFPDFSRNDYRVLQQIGYNRSGGQVTYRAVNIQTDRPVIIKQFQFAKSDSSWSGYSVHNQEIQVLQGLDHPGIPKYLDSFQTPDGFCMVQEYKQAESLAVPRSFNAHEIKQIAASALEILVYLQNRIPPIIHRDIKPENVLVDDNINVYLVDFGFARIGDGDVAMSSITKGTLGFMPPEQLFNRQLTEASDLYSLGVTLVCLLTGIRSSEITNLIDDSYCLDFEYLVPKLSLRWIAWVKKLVELRPKDRYPNAAAALEALKPIYVVRLPEATFSRPRLEFHATRLGEKLTQTVTVTNSIPETMLKGLWEVAAHPSDLAHPLGHSWIRLQSAQFEDNSVVQKIVVDTRKLMAGRTYTRKLLLHSNALPETHTLTLIIQTAAIPVDLRQFPHGLLLLLIGGCSIAIWVETAAWNGIVSDFGTTGGLVAALVTGLIAVLGAMTAPLAREAARWIAVRTSSGANFKMAKTGVTTLIAGALALLIARFGSEFRTTDAAAATFVAVDAVAFVAGFKIESLVESFSRRGFSVGWAVAISLMATALSVGLGIGLNSGLHPLVLTIVLTAGLPLLAMLLFPAWRRVRVIGRYRRLERQLIQP